MDNEYGHLEIKLNDLLQKKGLNKNKLSHNAEMTWKKIANDGTDTVTRLDVSVLCKLCTALDCEIQDLLVFYPPEQKN